MISKGTEYGYKGIEGSFNPDVPFSLIHRYVSEYSTLKVKDGV